jgi:hypothetical protein
MVVKRIRVCIHGVSVLGAFFFLQIRIEEAEEEFNRLPWLGQSGRAAAGCACTAAALRC